MIDGNTIIDVLRAGTIRKMKLLEAYDRYHRILPSDIDNWDPNFPSRLKCLYDDGEIRFNELEDIILKEYQEVVKVTLGSGKTIRVTPDRKIASADRSWVAAMDLKRNTFVLTSGGKDKQTLFDGTAVERYIPKMDHIESVIADGRAEVFDVVMKGPHRHFVANGVIIFGSAVND